jgi:hypothetical protein
MMNTIAMPLGALLLLALMAGCGHDDADSAQINNTIHIVKKAKTGPTVAEQTKGMAVASSGKPTAPVDIKFDIKQKPATGTPVDVEIAFLPAMPADSLAVDLVPSEGLVMQVAENPLQIAGIEAGKIYRRTVTVTAPADGMYYLGIVATLKIAEQLQTRSFSIPLIVGSPGVAAKPTLATDTTGQPIETSAAVETVKQGH